MISLQANSLKQGVNDDYVEEAQTSQSQLQKFPVTDVFSDIEVADGRIWLKPDGIECIAGDLPEVEQKLVWATQAVPVPDLFMQRSGLLELSALNGDNTMLQAHVVLSLVGIVSGLVVLYGLLTGKPFGGWTGLFLGTTMLTTTPCARMKGGSDCFWPS